MSEEEKTLKKTSTNMKNTARIMQEQMKQQDLLCEAIEVETERNNGLFSSNMARFREAVRKMNNDPRNKIMFLLVLIIVGCCLYIST